MFDGVNFFPVFLFYVDICFPCMHVCAWCVCSACGNQKGALDHQTWVAATWEQPCGCWVLIPSPLEEQSLLITAQQSLQLRCLATLSPFLPLPSPSYMALWHRLWLSKGKCFLASSDSLTILLSGGKVFEFAHGLWPVFSGHPLYHEPNNLVKETSNDMSFRRLGNLNLSLWVDSLSFNTFWGAGM